MQMQLVFVRLIHIQHFHMWTFHSVKWGKKDSMLMWWLNNKNFNLIFIYPTANQSPVGQKPNENICELKSYWCNWRFSLKSQCRTVLSRPPVQSLLPSTLISIQEAPSVWPWNWRINDWLCRSQTAILPSEQQLKQIFESGEIASA